MSNMNIRITCRHQNSPLDCRQCDAEAQGGVTFPGYLGLKQAEAGECIHCATGLARSADGQRHESEFGVWACKSPLVAVEGFKDDGKTVLVVSRTIGAVAGGMLTELESASAKWPPFNSAHEGFAVLAEEVDELWDHVKVNQKRRDLAAMRKEALQVAAMALRFALDVCDEHRGRK